MIITIKSGNGGCEYTAQLLFHELQKDAAAFCSRSKKEKETKESLRLLRAGCMAAFAYLENYTDFMLRRLGQNRRGSLHEKIKRLTRHAAQQSVGPVSPDISEYRTLRNFLVHGAQGKPRAIASNLELISLSKMKPQQLASFLGSIRTWRRWLENATGVNPLIEKHRELLKLVHAIHEKQG